MAKWGSEREAALEKLCAEATPGPWRVETQQGDGGEEYLTGHITAETHTYAGNSKSRRDSVCDQNSLTWDDAAFIVASRTDLPDLLAHTRKQSEVIRGLVRDVGYMLDLIYPEDIFTGESGDPGPVAINKARQALAAARELETT